MTTQYNGNSKVVTSGSSAEADFDFQGNGQTIAKANGYTDASVGVEAVNNCPAGSPTPASTTTESGQVLGTSTMAGTGSPLADLANLVFSFGAGLIGLGVKTYAKKNH